MTTPQSLTSRLAAYFRARSGIWVDARQLAAVAGWAGWRTRVSELRRPPHLMTIVNRVRHVRRHDGGQYTISEYRLIERSEHAHMVSETEAAQ